MKYGDFHQALELYELALEQTKTMLEIYLNKGLAELRLFRYSDCIKSCSRLLQFCEIFDEGYEKRKKFCCKALLRRAEAKRHLQLFEEVKEDLMELKKLDSEVEPKLVNYLLEEAEECQIELRKFHFFNSNKSYTSYSK